jgi:hypothetical protein
VADKISVLAISAGVTMLRHEAAEVDGLQFAGMDDFHHDPEIRSFHLRPGLI